jgi:hypothetical protein
LVLTAQAAFLRGTSMPVMSLTAAQCGRWVVKGKNEKAAEMQVLDLTAHISN